MPDILLLSGSPSVTSRSAALLESVGHRLEQEGLTVASFSVHDFPAGDLVHANFASPAFEPLKQNLASAGAVVIATPVYKASYSGSLKTLLDILPQNALSQKAILPLVTGGTPAHLLALEYALKPVLSVLGATTILQGVFVVDTLFVARDGSFLLDPELQTRLEESLSQLIRALHSSPSKAIAA